VTEYTGSDKPEPPNWWAEFWNRHAAAGTKLPDYILMQRTWRETGGNTWYPENEEVAETLYSRIITERQQQQPVFK